MSGAFAAHWFRVAPLRPTLRAHAQVHRHVARGQVWFVMQDHQTGRFFRISPAANLLLCLLDGRRTVEAVWRMVADKLGPERPSQDETVRLLVQLHQSDLLTAELPPDMAELGRRADSVQSQRWRTWFTSPMAMRFPLADPDRFLAATLPLVRPLFTRAGFVLWLALLAAGLLLAVLHWPELSADVSDRVFTTYNVVMLALLYPASKAMHELGHAYAVKVNGGAVHEVGLMVLVFFPVPYVDATAASAFPDRWRRILVSSAGIMVELALAALAMIVWVWLPPGLLRAASFNLLLLCSVSTLLFNGNPLLRFDGYYVLGDLLGIHNLDSRSRTYIVHLVQRFGLGMRGIRSPLQAPGEGKWLVGYGLVAFAYRIGVMIGIAALVSQRYFVLGLIAATFSVVQMLLLPAVRGVWFLFAGPALRRGRARAIIGAAAMALAGAAALFLVPVPYALVVQGVAWLPDEAVLHTRVDGFVAEILAPPGSTVAPDQPVFALRDPVAMAQADVLRTQLRVAQSQYDAVNVIDLVGARLAAEQLTHAQAALARATSRIDGLTVLAGSTGRFAVPDAAHLPGRFVHNGDVLGYVIGDGGLTVRAVVPEADIDLVRTRTRAVSVRYGEAVEHPRAAVIQREVPSALDRAPAAALTPEGGGPILADPTSPRHDRPLNRWFEVVVRPLGGTPPERIGERAYVRFDLGAEPVAWRVTRRAWQALVHLLHD